MARAEKVENNTVARDSARDAATPSRPLRLRCLRPSPRAPLPKPHLRPFPFYLSDRPSSRAIPKGDIAFKLKVQVNSQVVVHSDAELLRVCPERFDGLVSLIARLKT